MSVKKQIKSKFHNHVGKEIYLVPRHNGNIKEPVNLDYYGDSLIRIPDGSIVYVAKIIAKKKVKASKPQLI